MVSVSISEHQSKIEGLTARLLQHTQHNEAAAKAFSDIRVDISRLRDQLTQLGKERNEDLIRLGEIMKDSAKQTVMDVMSEVNSRCGALEQQLQSSSDALSALIRQEVEDKVRVDEV